MLYNMRNAQINLSNIFLIPGWHTLRYMHDRQVLFQTKCIWLARCGRLSRSLAAIKIKTDLSRSQPRQPRLWNINTCYNIVSRMHFNDNLVWRSRLFFKQVYWHGTWFFVWAIDSSDQFSESRHFKTANSTKSLTLRQMDVAFSWHLVQDAV